MSIAHRMDGMNECLRKQRRGTLSACTHSRAAVSTSEQACLLLVITEAFQTHCAACGTLHLRRPRRISAMTKRLEQRREDRCAHVRETCRTITRKGTKCLLAPFEFRDYLSCGRPCTREFGPASRYQLAIRSRQPRSCVRALPTGNTTADFWNSVPRPRDLHCPYLKHHHRKGIHVDFLCQMVPIPNLRGQTGASRMRTPAST
jgi:hypothetical protein